MPGREDFAIVRARLFADQRAHTAAAAYVAAGLAAEPTALAAVVGHVAALGLHAIRETDDGVLGGDGSIALAGVAYTCISDSRCACAALRDAGLLRPTEGGVYVVGFRDAYGQLIRGREAARERARRNRRSPNVRRTFADRSGLPDRTKYGPTVSGHPTSDGAETRQPASPETIRRVIDDARTKLGGRRAR